MCPRNTEPLNNPNQPLSAIQFKAVETDAWINWDLESGNPTVNAASDACLVFISAMATEGWDRAGLHDDFSDGLALNVARQCANTIVIVHAAGVRLVEQWIDHPNVTATVVAHLPGQDSGRALVKLLYGEADFSGKLPYTIARNESDYGRVLHPCGPSAEDPTDPQCDFSEGLYLDYRAFDEQGIEPRFEFGFGLSYTTFEYSSLSLGRRDLSPTSPCNGRHLWDTAAVVEASVANTGERDGQEVAQLYLAIPGSPPRQLRGFEKVRLAAGEEATVRFELGKRDFAVWDVVAQRWTVQAGEYEVFVGSSSRKLPLRKKFVVEDDGDL